jgi:predicted nucleotidyltransferase
MERLYPYMADISNLCRQYKVKTLYAFGSVLTNKFNKNSDVDLIVDFQEIPVEDYADNYFDLKFSLQDVFKRPIDLLEEQAIKNPYFRQSLEQKKQLIYGE